MKRIWFYLFVLLAFNSKSALCCSCMAPGTPAQELKDADAVFVGQVLVVTPSLGGKKVLFKVDKSWKGIGGGVVTIETDRHEGLCGYAFGIGQEYLVYAWYGDGNSLSTNTCSRTTSLSTAAEDLAILGAGTAHSSTGLWIMFLFGVGLLSILILRFKPKRKPVE